MVELRPIRDMRAQPPRLTWVPVTGADGRVRMEMRWHIPDKKASGSPPHAA